ncbi:Putative metallocarboxypeptidase ecm14 [Hirsutella minnesotensis 3608]|uniref:Inactive metallocarboxypeptidase ECM14 n=1 Tax=Hirsutella minnesotensis 3608 TaxID=1043627 RepID=A0A0F7ZKV4_9HYPO|nr:Putative metallocarboxypeptidase ecm14 [Hirsutella minnesotensis 3608]
MTNPKLASVTRKFSGPLAWLSVPFVVLSVLLLLHLTHAADASWCCANRDVDSVPLFPLLTRLRDSAVELVFGSHPSKADARVSAFDGSSAKYANELVLRFNVTTPDEETALAEAATRLFLDVWAFGNDFVDVRLRSDEIGPLLGLLPDSLQSSQSTLIPDLAAAVHQSLPLKSRIDGTEAEGAPWAASKPLSAEDNLFFKDYQPFPVIVRWMRLLEAMFPSYVKFLTIGKSFEGRDIPGLRVGLPSLSTADTPRKTVVITGGLHAREWISISTVNYLAWSFIASFGKERMVTKLLSEFDLLFLPALNPDGLEYTWKTDRLWRKSRQSTNVRFCQGLDLDRAFGHQWDDSQVRNDPCSESYGGEKPFQAVEAEQLASWARNESSHKTSFVGFVDLHSYSQEILYPYSSSCVVEPPNLENLEEVAAGIARAIRISNGESYAVMPACEGAVATAATRQSPSKLRVESGGGSAIDWFYHEMGARFSYQIKLRDTGSYGFLLPKEQIIPAGEETFNAMKYFGDYLLGNNGIEGGRSSQRNGPKDHGSASRKDKDMTMELRKRKHARR